MNMDTAFFLDEGVSATVVQCKFIHHAADVSTTQAMAMRDSL